MQISVNRAKIYNINTIIGAQMLFKRTIMQRVKDILQNGKSVLLLGPRQVGKTTMIESQITTDINYSMLLPKVRRQFEQVPDDLIDEIQAFKILNPNIKMPLVYIDEVQLVPELLDVVQYMIDKGIAQFILTGSSARKLLKRKEGINLLPGRLINCQMDTLSISEMQDQSPSLNDLLVYGSLPEVVLQTTLNDKEELLSSYLDLYLEQEVRAEALVRHLGDFSRFLTLAGIESGNSINTSKVSSDLGISRNTINEYFQVLEDCLIVDRIDAITSSTSRSRLTKASKYLFYDLGVRRLSANEGTTFPDKYMGNLFEQFIGLECLKIIRTHKTRAKLKYWSDHSGPEVDYVIESNQSFLPIEVKYTTKPTASDAKHLKVFMSEYNCPIPGIVFCRTDRPKVLCEKNKIIALPWRDLPQYLNNALEKLG